MNSLPKTVNRQRRGCDLNPGPSAPESSTLTTRLPSHPTHEYTCKKSSSKISWFNPNGTDTSDRITFPASAVAKYTQALLTVAEYVCENIHQFLSSIEKDA